jgi:hypothetical protein
MLGGRNPPFLMDQITSSRKATAVMKTVSEKLSEAISNLEWDCYDNVVVEIGGTQVSGIHQPEDYNKKLAAPYGTRKYNKDAFIVIKNLDRTPFEPSKPFPEGEFKPAHPYQSK